MEFVGYARVSSTDQNFDAQVEALKKAGCIKIFAEKKSGTSKKERTAFQECMEYIRENDTLVVTRVDRLTRSILDLQHLLFDLKERKIEIKALEQPVDTASANGKFFLDMLGVFAEFETNLRRERQLEGVARAKQQGKYKGRKPTARVKTNQIIELTQKGFTRKAIAEKLNIGIASIYRILKAYKANHPDIPLPGSRSNIKIATVEVHLRVENNSKFVRGKNKSREDIERQCFSEYDMTKHNDWEYELKVPYQSKEDLQNTLYEIAHEASSIADMRNGFIEMDMIDPKTRMSLL